MKLCDQQRRKLIHLEQATILASVQAQMISSAAMTNGTTAQQMVNAFWLGGLVLDVYGAVLASLAARWFEVLKHREVEHFQEVLSKKKKVEQDKRRARGIHNASDWVRFYHTSSNTANLT